MLGLIWQIIKCGLFAKIDLKHHPELFRLLEEDETIDDLLKLPTDQLLLRWFNYHLKKANHPRRTQNFSGDLKVNNTLIGFRRLESSPQDSENYTVLLAQLEPSQCSRAPLKEQDLTERAEQMLQNAEKIGCRKYLTPKAVVTGNPKLNLAFCANLFNEHPGIQIIYLFTAGVDKFAQVWNHCRKLKWLHWTSGSSSPKETAKLAPLPCG